VIQHQSLDGLHQAASEPIDKHSLLIRLRDALGWDAVAVWLQGAFAKLPDTGRRRGST